MRALVTGGAGFIGSNVVDALLARGDEVAVVDDLSTGRIENLEAALAAGAVFHQLDIRDADAVNAAFEAARPEVVFHFAAQMDVRRSLADPAFDASVNVVGTINVLEAAHASGARRLINTSTGGAIYGETEVMPTPETVAAAPVSAYGQSKQCAELYCAWAGRARGLETVTLRYGNVYGPRQDPGGEAGVIAIFAGRLISGEPPTVYGDGSALRDYTFVDDIVAANLLAAAQSTPGGPYNIGTGIDSSVLELIEAIDATAAPGEAPLNPEFAAAREGELQRSSLDVSLARDELGFSAATDLKKGVAATVEALRDDS
jgi:UDP-glucose 4-epimerase